MRRDFRHSSPGICGTWRAPKRLWNHYIAFFFSGMFFTNALPHLTAGSMGRPFQSPFAKPPGQGLSSALVNVLWGSFNVIVGYVLLFHVGSFDARELMCVAPALVETAIRRGTDLAGRN